VPGAGGFGVSVIYKDKPVEVTTPVFWDWDDDDEDQLRISFYIKKPEEL
jgi:hypothetical protein